MNATDFVYVETKAGARIHRASCKRIPSGGQPLDKVLGFAPGTAAQAKAASCCKPQIDEVLAGAREALAANPVGVSPERRHFTPEREDEVQDDEPEYEAAHRAAEESESDRVPDEAPEPVQDEKPDASDEDPREHYTRHVAYKDNGGPRRFWMSYMVGGEAIASAKGATARRDRATDSLVIEGMPAPVVEAEDLVRAAWAAVPAALKVWTDRHAAEHETSLALFHAQSAFIQDYLTNRFAGDDLI